LQCFQDKAKLAMQRNLPFAALQFTLSPSALLLLLPPPLQVMSAEDVLVQIGVLGSINLQSVLNSCKLFNGSINVGSVVGGVFTIRVEAQLGFQVGGAAHGRRCWLGIMPDSAESVRWHTGALTVFKQGSNG
jgi:hypothetical protein